MRTAWGLLWSHDPCFRIFGLAWRESCTKSFRCYDVSTNRSRGRVVPCIPGDGKVILVMPSNGWQYRELYYGHDGTMTSNAMYPLGVCVFNLFFGAAGTPRKWSIKIRRGGPAAPRRLPIGYKLLPLILHPLFIWSFCHAANQNDVIRKYISSRSEIDALAASIVVITTFTETKNRPIDNEPCDRLSSHLHIVGDEVQAGLLQHILRRRLVRSMTGRGFSLTYARVPFAMPPVGGTLQGS